MTKRKHLGFLAIIFVMIMMMAMPAFAAKKKTVKMKANKKYTTFTYSGRYEGEKYIYHKFKIKETGILRITGYELTKKDKKRGFSIMLCNKDKKRLDLNKTNYINFNKGTIKYYVLSKGTYYIRVQGTGMKKKSRYLMEAKLTSLESLLTQSSPNKRTAVKLTSGTPSFVVVPASAGTNYSRWVYFYTDGKDPISITLIPQPSKSNQGSFRAKLYGPAYKKEGQDDTYKLLTISKGGDRYKLSTQITSRRGGVTTTRTAGLKKGYYYLEISRDTNSTENQQYANGYVKILLKD